MTGHQKRTRQLGRNRRWEGGTDSNDIVIWVDEHTYRPTKITAEIEPTHRKEQP